MNEVTCHPIGTKVKLGGDTVDGEITAVCVRGNAHVTYEVEWWSGNTRCEGWFHESQIVLPASGGATYRIGFRASPLPKPCRLDEMGIQNITIG